MSALRFRSGKNTRAVELLGLNAISATSGRRRWRHPWTTTALWYPNAKSWVATIEPGFVNGYAPIIRSTIREQSGSGRDFGINPLTGKPFFSDNPPFAPAKEMNRTIDIPIYLGPALSFLWRAVGFDGSAQFPVPEFFLERGVREAPRIDADSIDTVDVSAITPTRGLRLLRACDFWLHQPRLALTSQISLEPGPATGISNVTQTLGLRFPPPADALQIFAGFFQPIDSAPIDPLAGGAFAGLFEERTWDELLIATVYLLSPPDADFGSEPDGNWTPYVRHGLFWNLNYRQPSFRQLDSDPRTPFIPPLAAGAAQLVINFLTASLNDLTRQSLNILSAHSMAGTFWTPTGGGHTAEFPPAEESAPEGDTGLDKDGRLARQATTAEAAKRASRLDPEFPFRAMPFDPALLV